jgi:dTDP-4-amino-4,6-dideoxygalactose transaminase
MDPKRVYAQWGAAAEESVLRILRSHAYVKGEHVAGLEAQFATYAGTRHAVAVDSGTDALDLVLRSVFEDRPASAREVILPSFTFVATAGAVVNAGGRPVFADVLADTQCIDPEAVRRLASDRTAAVIPVHLFGSPADVPAVRAALGGRKAFVLEDAAQSIHATLHGRRAGSLADAAAFSFYPSKNVGAAGDGGMVTTDDPRVAEVVQSLRDHGQRKKLYDSDRVGTNSRMDEIQAAVLRHKLPFVDAWTRERRQVAARYDAAFQGTAVVPQRAIPGAQSAYHLYTVRVPHRDEVRADLQAREIGCGVYYPLPLHRQTCFARFDPAPCPVADRLATEVLSLPCFPGLTRDEQDRVIAEVRAAVARRGA